MSGLKEIQVIDYLILNNNSGFYLLDVRPLSEFQNGFIPKSLNLDFQHKQFDSILAQIINNLPHNFQIIFVIEKGQKLKLEEKLVNFNVNSVKGFIDIRKYNSRNIALDQALQYAKKGKILLNQTQTEFFIIDMRNKSSFDQFHLKGAIHGDVFELLFNIEKYQSVFPKEKYIYIYDLEQENVSLVVSILKKHGFNNVVFINMHQLEDLQHKNGFYDPPKKVLPSELQYTEESEAEKAKISDFSEVQNIKQQNQEEEEQQRQIKHQFSKQIVEMLESPPDSDEEKVLPTKLPETNHLTEDQKKIYDSDPESPAELPKKICNTDFLDSIDIQRTESSKPDFTKKTKQREADSENEEEENEDDVQELDISPSQSKMMRPVLMSKKSMIHNELEIKHFTQKEDDWKEEREMEGFTLQHILKDANYKLKKTKIICTIGPSCNDVETLVQMIDNGMNIARLNFSHGDHKSHFETLKNIREAQKQRPIYHIGVLLDTKGPEIRTGFFEEGIKKIKLTKGQDLKITTDYSFKGNNQKIACSYEDLPTSVKVGKNILIADGSLVCKVKEILNSGIMVEVLNDAEIGERKNMNLPGCIITLDTVTEKDEEDIIEFGLKHRVDFIALSFTRTSEDIEIVKDLLGPRGSGIKVIAKIENQDGLKNYEEILSLADGIMIARGDLGMEIPTEKVFVAQKFMTLKANKVGKPVICATQMLESMINNPRPTRAEASDVANSVLDGVDCVMLSGETANGLFPVDCVNIMSKICKESELCVTSMERFSDEVQQIFKERKFTELETMCSNAVSISFEMGLPLIIVFTVTGTAARCVSKFKPRSCIVAVSDQADTIKSLTMISGVICLRVPSIQCSQSMVVKHAVAKCLNDGLCKYGDQVVVVLDELDNQCITLRDVNEEVRTLTEVSDFV